MSMHKEAASLKRFTSATFVPHNSLIASAAWHCAAASCRQSGSSQVHSRLQGMCACMRQPDGRESARNQMMALAHQKILTSRLTCMHGMHSTLKLALAKLVPASLCCSAASSSIERLWMRTARELRNLAVQNYQNSTLGNHIRTVTNWHCGGGVG